MKFDVKQSRSYSHTVLDDGSTGESSPQFNESSAVRLTNRLALTNGKLFFPSSFLLQSPSRLLSGRRNNIDFLESPRSFGPIILPNATIKVRLRNGIRLVFVVCFDHFGEILIGSD